MTYVNLWEDKRRVGIGNSGLGSKAFHTFEEAEEHANRLPAWSYRYLGTLYVAGDLVGKMELRGETAARKGKPETIST